MSIHLYTMEDNLKRRRFNLDALKEKDSGQLRVEHLNYLINCSKIIHMWPQNNPSTLQSAVHHFIVWTIFVNCCHLIFTLLLQLVVDYKNVDEIAGVIDFGTVFISAVFRYMYIYFKGDKYLELVSLLHDNFLSHSLFPGKRRASLEKYQKIAKRLVFSYAIFTCLWVLQVILMPLIKYARTNFPSNEFAFNDTRAHSNEYPSYPINIYILFDISQLSIYVAYYLYQIAVFVIFTMIYVVVDSFWVTVILLTIGQFYLIKSSIDTLMENTKNCDSETKVELLDSCRIDDVEAKLIKCVQHHEFTKRFVRFMEELYSPNVLVNALHSIISITFILLEMTVAINKEAWNKFLPLVQYLLISLVHMFVYDWLGNELLVKEEEIRNAIYNLPWYKYPSQKAKILLVQQLSGHGTKITGGKIYKLTLELFITTMRIVFSYFSFLLQIRDRNSRGNKI